MKEIRDHDTLLLLAPISSISAIPRRAAGQAFLGAVIGASADSWNERPRAVCDDVLVTKCGIDKVRVGNVEQSSDDVLCTSVFVVERRNKLRICAFWQVARTSQPSSRRDEPDSEIAM